MPMKWPDPKTEICINDNCNKRIAELEAALRPFAAYAKARRVKPLNGLGDVIHNIHRNTEWEAEITMQHCMAAEKALGRYGAETMPDVIKQHLEWIRLYVESARPGNWRDMLDRIEHQIERAQEDAEKLVTAETVEEN